MVLVQDIYIMDSPAVVSYTPISCTIPPMVAQQQQSMYVQIHTSGTKALSFVKPAYNMMAPIQCYYAATRLLRRLLKTSQDLDLSWPNLSFNFLQRSC